MSSDTLWGMVAMSYQYFRDDSWHRKHYCLGEISYLRLDMWDHWVCERNDLCQIISRSEWLL